MTSDFQNILDNLFNHFDVGSISELADKMEVSQPTVSKWKARNSISAIKKKCRELGIYNEIFGDVQTNNFQNSTNVVGQDFSKNNKSSHTQNNNANINIDPNFLKLVDTLYGYAKANDKIDELKTDLLSLLPKYM